MLETLFGTCFSSDRYARVVNFQILCNVKKLKCKIIAVNICVIYAVQIKLTLKGSVKLS